MSITTHVGDSLCDLKKKSALIFKELISAGHEGEALYEQIVLYVYFFSFSLLFNILGSLWI